jgi:hypothetical protein
MCGYSWTTAPICEYFPEWQHEMDKTEGSLMSNEPCVVIAGPLSSNVNTAQNAIMTEILLIKLAPQEKR